MSNRKDTARNALYLIMISLVVVLFSVWFFLLHQRTVSPDTSANDVSSIPTTETLYRNDTYHFSMQYDKTYFSRAEDTSQFPWRINSSDPGELLVKLALQKTSEQKTNFSEAYITVGASGETNAVATCLRAQNGETASGITQLGNTSFFVFAQTGAAAGNLYQTKSYRVIQNGKCFAIESTIHSTNIGNYDPSQGVMEFDRAAIEKMLSSVVDTFRFE